MQNITIYQQQWAISWFVSLGQVYANMCAFVYSLLPVFEYESYFKSSKGATHLSRCLNSCYQSGKIITTQDSSSSVASAHELLRPPGPVCLPVLTSLHAPFCPPTPGTLVLFLSLQTSQACSFWFSFAPTVCAAQHTFLRPLPNVAEFLSIRPLHQCCFLRLLVPENHRDKKPGANALEMRTLILGKAANVVLNYFLYFCLLV